MIEIDIIILLIWVDPFSYYTFYISEMFVFLYYWDYKKFSKFDIFFLLSVTFTFRKISIIYLFEIYLPDSYDRWEEISRNKGPVR